MSDFKTVVPSLEGLDPSKRVNYTLGMVLGEDEFRQEQVYFIGKNRLHNRALHGYGTVYGLKISLTGTAENPQLVVSPGLAINPLGQEIIVGPDQCAYLNQWLKMHKDDPEMPLQSPPTSSPDQLTLYLVLCYVACETDNIPLPGTPCRKEEDTFAASRLQDDFELNLAFKSPPMLEETAVRRFGDLLNRLEISSEAPVYLLDDDPDGLVKLVRQIGEVSAEDCFIPPEFGSPAAEEELIFLRPETACEELRRALQAWVTETRPHLLERQAAEMEPGDDNCVLLAKIEFPLAADFTVDGDITIDESCRPYLLHTRLLQEWLMCGRGGSNVSRGGDNIFATIYAYNEDRAQKTLRMWVHHPQQLDIPKEAVELIVDDVPVSAFSVVPDTSIFNLFELRVITPSTEPFFDHNQRINIRFDASQILDTDAGTSLAEVIGQEDYDYVHRNADQIISVFEVIFLPYLDDLLDVYVKTAKNGQILKYNGKMWRPGDLSIDELTDVETSKKPGAHDKDVLTWNEKAKLWVPAKPEATPIGPAGGDLRETYPNPLVRGIQGRAVSENAPNNGDVYVWNNEAGSWMPGVVSPGGAAGGDLRSNYPNPLVAGIQGRSVLNANPVEGALLAWNQAKKRWEPLVVKPTEIPQIPQPPQLGDVLTWNGKQWIAAPPAAGQVENVVTKPIKTPPLSIVAAGQFFLDAYKPAVRACPPTFNGLKATIDFAQSNAELRIVEIVLTFNTYDNTELPCDDTPHRYIIKGTIMTDSDTSKIFGQAPGFVVTQIAPEIRIQIRHDPQSELVATGFMIEISQFLQQISPKTEPVLNAEIAEVVLAPEKVTATRKPRKTAAKSAAASSRATASTTQKRKK